MAGFVQWHAIITSGSTQEAVKTPVRNWLNSWQEKRPTSSGNLQKDVGLTDSGEVYQLLFAGLWNPPTKELSLVYSDRGCIQLGIPIGTIHDMIVPNEGGSISEEDLAAAIAAQLPQAIADALPSTEDIAAQIVNDNPQVIPSKQEIIDASVTNVTLPDKQEIIDASVNNTTLPTQQEIADAAAQNATLPTTDQIADKAAQLTEQPSISDLVDKSLEMSPPPSTQDILDGIVDQEGPRLTPDDDTLLDSISQSIIPGIKNDLPITQIVYDLINLCKADLEIMYPGIANAALLEALKDQYGNTYQQLLAANEIQVTIL